MVSGWYSWKVYYKCPQCNRQTLKLFRLPKEVTDYYGIPEGSWGCEACADFKTPKRYVVPVVPVETKES